MSGKREANRRRNKGKRRAIGDQEETVIAEVASIAPDARSIES